MKSLELFFKKRVDGEPDRIFIIAEMANAHQGDPAIAELLVDSVAQAGADAVKLQICFANELFSKSHLGASTISVLNNAKTP